MGSEARDRIELGRRVYAAFRRLPNCPDGLTVIAEPMGNIRIEAFGRSFVINALLVAQSGASDAWCANVLRIALGVPGLRGVNELKRRAQITAGLTPAELQILSLIHASYAIRFLDARCLMLCRGLEQKGLLEIHPGSVSDLPSYQLTDCGRDALAAHSR